MINNLRVILERTFPEPIYRRMIDNPWTRRAMARKARNYTPLTPVHLASNLRNLGVTDGDLLLAHSSYDSFRGMEGGVMGLINALFEAVGPNGTIVMPTFAQGSMKEIVENRPFDVRKTPSEAGLLTEVFRRMKGVERSLHPYHSVAAKGPLATWLVEGHAASLTPFGKYTPFGRLVEAKGKILVMGVSLHWSLTIVHVVEDIMGEDFPVPVYLDEPICGVVIDENGTERTVSTKVHDDRIRKHMNISLIHTYLKDLDCMRTKRMDGIILHLLDASKVVARLVGLARRGITVYGERQHRK